MPDTHDLVAYPGLSYANTHPDRLAATARLHGLEPAPVESCRVLEIGCNEGANLIPMAYAIPGAEFVGFDIAELPVARAQESIAALSLGNISIFQGDITTVGPRLGEFDYIIAHGIYAWVPDNARDSLLALCRNHLAKNGIAFVSYNALPGSFTRAITRQVLQNRVAAAADPIEGVSDGIKLLGLMAQLRPEGDALGSLLADEAVKLQKRSPRQIFHDELAPAHAPVLFSTFAGHARSHGLTYVSESTVPSLEDPFYQPQAAALARELSNGDRIAEEQVRDFIRMRAYRETLLCHAGMQPTAEPLASALPTLRFASQAQPASARTPGGSAYRGSTGLTVESSDAGVIAALDYLMDQWPSSVPFAELASVLEATISGATEELLSNAFHLVAARLIEVHTWNAPVSTAILGERPRASAWARHQVVTRDVTTTLHHHPMEISDPVVRLFIQLLDGTRDRAALAAAIREQRPDVPESMIASGVEMSLHLLHKGGVLVAEGFREA